MNGIKRIYCRAFQLCFRAALPLLPYREPEILDSMEELGRLLAEKGKNNTNALEDRASKEPTLRRKKRRAKLERF